jgi:hypothetical protein
MMFRLSLIVGLAVAGLGFVSHKASAVSLPNNAVAAAERGQPRAKCCVALPPGSQEMRTQLGMADAGLSGVRRTVWVRLNWALKAVRLIGSLRCTGSSAFYCTSLARSRVNS